METIIGLLIVILPVVFKLIGKKLEQAGQTAATEAEPIEDWAQTLRRHLEAQQVAGTAPVQEAAPSVRTAEKPSASKVKSKPVSHTVKAANPILKEEPKKKREKIDTKKMIVYSEIMKPKYME